MAKRVQGKCTPPIIVVSGGEVYCWECWCAYCKEYPDNKIVCDYLLSCFPWGFTPRCCKCNADMLVQVIQPPPNAWKKETILEHKTQGHGEVIRWAAICGLSISTSPYMYQVYCKNQPIVQVWYMRDCSAHQH